MTSKHLILTITLTTIACVSACKNDSPPSKEDSLESPNTSLTEKNIAPEDKALWTQANQLFKILATEPDSPQQNPTSPEKVQLGKMLFHDPRLSKSSSISCNSCHGLASYGVDNRETSIGHKFQTGERNSPTVLNSSLNFVQFWDGRAKDLESQAAGPILNPVEMAMDSEHLAIERIQSISQYQNMFQKVFPESSTPITYSNITRAIAAFERTLLTPSAFDRYLAGDGNSLSKEEKEGLQTYISYGCTACHNGMGLGGGLYQKFGILAPYTFQKDTGRFQVTKKPEDTYVFKVPGLRNVARTAPYFHDGKVWSLEEAVKIMAKTQLGKEMPPEDANKIVLFLNTLTGEIPEDALKLPVLPPSSDTTPHPED